MRVPLPVRALSPVTFETWLTPPPLGARAAALDSDALADMGDMFFGGVPGHETGEGPLVVALHGWGGRGAQMAPVARHLASMGLRVVIPDMPGHAGGPRTDIKESSAVLRDVIEDTGEPVAIIAHSFASMVLRLAFVEAAPSKVVLVAPALDVRDALRVFGDRLQLMPWVRRGLRKRLERWDPALWPTLAGLCPDQLPGAEILIVHDPDDQETPFSRSAELAAIRPATSILPLPGAGHSRILSERVALDAVADFVGESVRDESAA